MRLTRRMVGAVVAGIIVGLGARSVGAQSGGRDTAGVDLTRQPTLYVVPYAHLDTQWLWDYVPTITEYLPNTLTENFGYFAQYPHYVFNFTGSNRYRFIKEYYPARFDTLKQWVAKGRWFPGGSAVEEGDVNGPSAESIWRQILYSNEWFRGQFDTAGADFMLPDCFGFPASLPSILAHAGIVGFSTQKLSAKWQPAALVGGPTSVEQTPVGIPFNVGVWQGPDGRSVIAAFNPGRYDSQITYDLSRPLAASAQRDPADVNWPTRIAVDGKASGIFADYHYFGNGDVGGAMETESARMLEDIVSRGGASGDSSVRVVPSFSDRMFRDIARTGATDRLPRYTGELELINHSAGSLTSQAQHKQWNHDNEVLADAAERASVAAAWLGARAYPKARLTDAWTLVLGGQFHDIYAGTANPKAYQYSWNDDVIALNQFAGVVTSASAGVASVMNTDTRGIPVVVYNPLSIARSDIVAAVVRFPTGRPQGVIVQGPDGKRVPAQVSGDTVLFLATVPSVGYAVYDVRPMAKGEASSGSGALAVSDSVLENARYRVRIDRPGDIASIYDKSLRAELLSAPMQLALQTEWPKQYPAWNMDWEDQRKAPRAYVGGPAAVRVVERGPARVAVEIRRKGEADDSSTFVATVRLSAGDAGNRVEIANGIDWHAEATALKATLPLVATNAEATYNWDVGTIRRTTNHERQYEVASHQWIDLTDTSGRFGVTLLTDAKNGSDKPDDRTLRLTLLYTPGVTSANEPFAFQESNDWGHHAFTFGVASHAGEWRTGKTDWQAYRLSQPLIAMVSERHRGALGRTFSMLKLSTDRVRVLAVKQAEASDEVVVRLVELDGRARAGVHIRFAAPVIAAREVDAQERTIGHATVVDGAIETSFGAYSPKTFAVRLAAPTVKAVRVVSRSVSLAYDRAVTSTDGMQAAPGFDDQGNALPGELVPSAIDFAGVRFVVGPTATGAPNAVVARGQRIVLPEGPVTRVYLLAASADSDRTATFAVDGVVTQLRVQSWGGFVGSADTRLWRPTLGHDVFGAVTGIAPGAIKPADIAWYASHHHTSDGANVVYAYSYLFAYAIDVPSGQAHTLTLPNDDRIRVLAVTAAEEPSWVWPSVALYGQH